MILLLRQPRFISQTRMFQMKIEHVCFKCHIFEVRVSNLFGQNGWWSKKYEFSPSSAMCLLHPGSWITLTNVSSFF